MRILLHAHDELDNDSDLTSLAKNVTKVIYDGDRCAIVIIRRCGEIRVKDSF
jgi:N-acetylglucosamine kinase-like BadF-type ATPase